MKIHEYKSYRLDEAQNCFDEIYKVIKEIKATYDEDTKTCFQMNCRIDGMIPVYTNGDILTTLAGLKDFLRYLPGRVYESSFVMIELRAFFRP